MGKKLHIICAKCGSDEVDIELVDATEDAPQSVMHFVCSNCKELTGVDEWAEFNQRTVRDRRKVVPGMDNKEE